METCHDKRIVHQDYYTICIHGRFEYKGIVREVVKNDNHTS
jgi:hypothetical protein